MIPFSVKMISFSSKGYKRQLIISKYEVTILQRFLEESLNCEVMVINTNIGLDVYYYSLVNHKDTILNGFLLLLAKHNKTIADFFVDEFDTKQDFIQKTNLFFNQLLAHPMLLKSYSKSLCHQINGSFESSPNIIKSLFLIWQDALMRLKKNKETKVFLLRTFLSELQEVYIQNKTKADMKDLIKAALATEHVN